jgi:hypothetical protein
LPSASGGGGGHIDNPTHCGVLVAVTGETVVGGGFVVLGADAIGGDGCCDAHPATPTHAIAMMAMNRIAFDMEALVSVVLVGR